LRAAAVSLPVAVRRPAPAGLPPVALLLPAPVRRQVVAFYRFAIAADDVADAPTLSGEEKLARLDRLEHGLAGSPDAEAEALDLHRAVGGNALLLDHASQLLHAFRRDAVCDHCRDWADLMTYCRFSAAPAGRFLLDLHGEPAETFAAGDALCAALQMLNLIQDCGKDYRALGRVYLPRDWLYRAGVATDALAGKSAPPELRLVIDEVLDGVDGLLELARPLPLLLRAWRLKLEAAVVIALADRLSRRLRVADPLAAAVRPTLGDVAVAAAGGLAHFLHCA